RWPFLFTQETFDNITAEKDRNPDQYYRMLVGWFAPEGISRRVCSMAMIDRFKCREKATFRGGDIEYFAALDPAFGGDKCILMIVKKGYEVTKKKVVMEIVEKCQIPI